MSDVYDPEGYINSQEWARNAYKSEAADPYTRLHYPELAAKYGARAKEMQGEFDAAAQRNAQNPQMMNPYSAASRIDPALLAKIVAALRGR